MELRKFGHTDLRVSAVGFGAGEIGYYGSTLELAAQLYGNVLDAGINVIDTAAHYGDGEEVIGRLLSDRRKEFYLFTKCGNAGGGGKAWESKALEASIDRSLMRLRTDYVDLMQLHSCDEATLRRGDAIEALQKAKQAGKTRYIGYSGDSEAALYAVESGAFDALQISINIVDQEALDMIVPRAHERAMGIIAKRPIAYGVWLGPSRPHVQVYWERLQKLDFDFVKKMDPLSAALRFTLTVPGVCTAIVGTTNPKRPATNVAAAEPGALPPAEYWAIRDRWRAVAPPDWKGLI